MSSIDLIILGIVMERPQSAYDIQKDVAYHQLDKWTRVSVPSIYKKVLQLRQNGDLTSTHVKGERFAEKAVYAITERGKARFLELMEACAAKPLAVLFDFNVVIANLNKLERPVAVRLLDTLESNFIKAREECLERPACFPGLPLAGRTIMDQQAAVCDALLAWLSTFRRQYEGALSAPPGGRQE